MSAEEAIARAKAIAARLAGTGATAAVAPSTADSTDVNAVADAALAAAFGGDTAAGALSSSGSKRKRWGGTEESGIPSGIPSGDPTSDALLQALNPKRANVGSGLNGHYGHGGGSQAVKKLMIPVDKYPGYNFIGLLIGPGGSKQRELVSQSGGNVKISIRGKGSSSNNNNNPNSHDDEALHVLLEGGTENVDRAEELILPLLNDPEKAQAEKDRQLALVSKANGGSTNTSSSSTYTPKPVAQIIGLNGTGGGGSQFGPSEGQPVIEVQIGIPNGFVGYIIGKGGESITSMQRKSGCRVQIQKEHEMEPGTTQRIITLTGSTPESVSMCRGIIEEMVQDRARLNESRSSSMGGGGGMGGIYGGGGGGSGPGSNAAAQAAQLQKALSEGQSHVTVAIPNNDVGLIIGKGGGTIRSIQERSGANVQIPQGPDHDNPSIRTINITHPQLSGAEFAKTLIEEVLKSKDQNRLNSGMGGVGYVANPSDVTVHVQIPDQDVGMCIGKSGCVIREMQQRTATKIQIPSQPTPGQLFRLATVTGSTEGCAKVQEIIARISAEQSSQFVMTGECFLGLGGTAVAGGYGQYGQQAYAQAYGATTAAYGQQPQGAGDYSAQWAAYYAAQGQTAAAATTQAVTAQAANVGHAAAGNAAATSTAAAGGQQKADAYYEDFFRYAYHYGEEAARKAYGAWSPPVGTTNPYGVNPNLATAAAGGATNNASSASVKDSSARRGVSNLPAWMTKS